MDIARERNNSGFFGCGSLRLIFQHPKQLVVSTVFQPGPPALYGYLCAVLRIRRWFASGEITQAGVFKRRGNRSYLL